MNRRVFKKFVVSSALVGIIGATGGQFATPMLAKANSEFFEVVNNEEMTNHKELSAEEFEHLIEILEQYLYVEDGHFKFNIAEIPFYQFQSYEQGVVNQLVNSVEVVNELADKGEVVINEDLSVVDTNIINVRGGSTYKENYWWGIRNYYSTTAAKNKITQVRNMAIAQGTAAGISGLFGFLPGAITGAIGSAWGNMLANSMENKNNQTNRGIIVDINWAAIYSVSIQ